MFDTNGGIRRNRPVDRTPASQAPVPTEGSERQRRTTFRVQRAENQTQRRYAVGDVIGCSSRTSPTSSAPAHPPSYASTLSSAASILMRLLDRTKPRSRTAPAFTIGRSSTMQLTEPNPRPRTIWGRTRALRKRAGRIAKIVGRYRRHVAARQRNGRMGDLAYSGRAPCRAAGRVNDVTQLNPIQVATVITPTTIGEIVDAVRAHDGPISIGGGRYSMGGRTATPGALQIDMRRFDQVLALDSVGKTITVQPGIRWRDIQRHSIRRAVREDHADVFELHRGRIDVGERSRAIHRLGTARALRSFVQDRARRRSPHRGESNAKRRHLLRRHRPDTAGSASSSRRRWRARRQRASTRQRAACQSPSIMTFSSATSRLRRRDLSQRRHLSAQLRTRQRLSRGRGRMTVTVPDRLIPTDKSYRIDRSCTTSCRTGQVSERRCASTSWTRCCFAAIPSCGANLRSELRRGRLEPASRASSSYVLSRILHSSGAIRRVRSQRCEPCSRSIMRT